MSPSENTQNDVDEKNPWDILDLTVKVDQVSKEGRSYKPTFTSEQIAELCEALDLTKLNIERLDLKLRAVSKSRFSLSGHIKFQVEQSCSITLEPVKSEFSEKLEARFWPEEAVTRYIENLPEIEADPFEDEPEIIENGEINLGRFIYESMATQIDPYPRKKDAEFNWQENNTTENSDDLHADKPFAALKILKKNGTED